MSLEANHNTDFTVGAYAGQMSADVDRESLLAWAADIATHVRASDVDVISDGRNRNVRVNATIGGARRDLLVKSFGRESPLSDRLRRARGSKARCTWDAAAHLLKHKVPTPRPVCFVERTENGCVVESYFVSDFLTDSISFTDALVERFTGDPQCVAFMDLLQHVADSIRVMHEAGFLHNDLGNQNILLQRDASGTWTTAAFIDLNRGRILPALTAQQRARDLSRIYLPSDFLRVFNEMYYGDVPPKAFLDSERRYRKRFALHTRTRAWRHPIRAARQRREGDTGEGPYPSEKDMWVWDEKSAQAVSALRSRDRHRYYPLAKSVLPALATLRCIVPVWRAYRVLQETCYTQEIAMRNRIGLGVDPQPDTVDRQDALLDALGNPPVLVRLYHHETQEQWAFRVETMSTWAAKGRRVAVVIVQDRRAVLAPEHWGDFVRSSVEACAPFATFVEVGHAINRVKWGAWDLNEWAALMSPLVDLAERFPSVRLTGPGAIDFEYPVVLGALERLPEPLRYHALSHLLYVDRRGAPENKQGRFDTLEKVTLARAMARAAHNCDDRLIVSEVNWPIAGTGEYSPVTSPYESPGPRYNDPNVSEDEYADYMLRYVCITLCSGMAEQVYWWRLVARGFGLVDDSDPKAWRERPAFRMLRHFLSRVGESHFVQMQSVADPQDGSDVVYLFRPETGQQFAVAYTTGKQPHAWDAGERFGLTATYAEDAFGEPLDLTSLSLSGRPVYLSVAS